MSLHRNDKDSGLLYVSDRKNNRILVFTEDGLPFYQLDLAKSTNGLAIKPRNIALDNSGKLFVVDKDNSKIHVFDTQAQPSDQDTQAQPSDQTLVGFKLYENHNHKVKMQYPSDWEQENEYSNSIVRFVARDSGETKSTGMLVSIFQRPPDSNLEEFIDFFHKRRYFEPSEFTVRRCFRLGHSGT